MMNLKDQIGIQQNVSQMMQQHHYNEQTSIPKLKAYQIVLFDNEKGNGYVAKVLSVAGKSTVIKIVYEYQSFINLDSNVQDEIAPINTAIEGDVTNMKTEQVFKINFIFDDAKQSELISWKSNNIC